MDHVRFGIEDVEFFQNAVALRMWSVELEPGVLAKLPNLRLLDVRGSREANLDFCLGCSQLRSLSLNGLRRLTDLAGLGQLHRLTYLNLYALSQVTDLPDFSNLGQLRFFGIGQMRRLSSLGPCWKLPNLHTLSLVNKLPIEESDYKEIDDMAKLREIFQWDESSNYRRFQAIKSLRPQAPGGYDFQWFQRMGLGGEIGL
jgi:hypothetical protein